MWTISQLPGRLCPQVSSVAKRSLCPSQHVLAEVEILLDHLHSVVHGSPRVSASRFKSRDRVHGFRWLLHPNTIEPVGSLADFRSTFVCESSSLWESRFRNWCNLV